MGDLPGREAQEAEDDVLDAGREEGIAARPDLLGLLADQIEDDREVVDAERPQCVLVLADLPQVLAVAVQAEDLAELAGLDELPQLLDAGVVEEQVARHDDEVALLRECAELLGLLGPERRRLLDEDVLPRRERAAREVEVGGDGRGDDDRVHRVVAEHLVEVPDGRAPAGSAPRVVLSCSRDASQIQVRRARSSKLRARFGPQ